MDTLVTALTDPLQLSLVVVGGVVAVHVIPYLVDPYGHRANSIDGPWLARFSDIWLARQAARGNRSIIVHEAHKQHGTFVRIAPNHVSISDPDALQVVYAHGNGTLKTEFYDAFVSIRRGLFNTRDRAEHTRKRKVISHIFSPKNVADFEPNIRVAMAALFKQLDTMCAGTADGGSTMVGDAKVSYEDDRAWFDCLPWFNFVAFDIIGDLVFGEPFGMIAAGRDMAAVAVGGEKDVKGDAKVKYIPAVQILNDRGDFSATLGTLPSWARPYIKKLPWFAKGSLAVQNLAGMAIAAVNKRLANPTDRVDLLTRLQQGKDDSGQPLAKEELTAEALTQLIAGSDTTSNSSCAIVYYLARHRSALDKLQLELDDAFGAPSQGEDIPWHEQLRKLPYLEACINEALRLHSTSSMGLARVVPAGGLEVSGQFFPEGSIISVPSYTIHRDRGIWGDDADEYRPERWFEIEQSLIQKTFNPFSFGPRACVGRNLAFMELLVIIGSFIRRYDIVLQHPDRDLPTREGFLRKPLECVIGLRRRV